MIWKTDSFERGRTAPLITLRYSISDVPLRRLSWRSSWLLALRSLHLKAFPGVPAGLWLLTLSPPSLYPPLGCFHLLRPWNPNWAIKIFLKRQQTQGDKYFDIILSILNDIYSEGRSRNPSSALWSCVGGRLETKARRGPSRLGRRNENISGNHLPPRRVSGFLSALPSRTLRRVL